MSDLRSDRQPDARFPLSRRLRVFTAVFYTFATVVGVGGIVSAIARGDLGGVGIVAVWMLAAGIQGWWLIFRMPREIEVDGDLLRFVARSRSVVVPLEALRSVSSPWYDLNRQVLQWRWDGGTLRTWGSYDGLHRLLQLIPERAPRAEIRGL